MCGSLISSIFGGGRQPAPPPVPAPPTPPPIPQPTVTAPIEAPATPTPTPQDDGTKKKAKITSKKVQKKKVSAGTSQLQIKKPTEGGVKGTGTPQGVNTGTAAAGAGTTPPKKQ